MSAPDADRPRGPVIAFYLPQFHPFPENDAWWGKGFTEWTNVVKARPLFEGHHQPQLPGELGYYDLRVPEVREQQAALAKAHGIDAFCYYHYWFGGRRVLDRPFDEVLRSGRPDLPFCLCWANENWTRAWDAGEHEVLLEQEYGEAERAEHIRYLVDAFADPRYLRHDGRPVFLFYRIQALPDAATFVAMLRQASVDAGLGDPYLVKFDTHGLFDDPANHGCDAAAQFLPHGMRERVPQLELPDCHPGNEVYDYAAVADEFVDDPDLGWTRHRCVFPGWDNTSRRGDGRSVVVVGNTPERYEHWLRRAVDQTRDGDGMVFVNAWNEWAEGAHLEPDERDGRAYLRATARAVLGREPDVDGPEVAGRPEQVLAGATFPELYLDLYDRYVRLQRRLTATEALLERRGDAGSGLARLDDALAEIAEMRARIAALEGRREGDADGH